MHLYRTWKHVQRLIIILQESPLIFSHPISRMVVIKRRGTGIQGSNLGGCWCNWPIPIFADVSRQTS
ncbi:hypothetical protein S245_001550 [Arachis hypogaea]